MFENLSRRELKVLDLLAHGYSNRQISEKLNIALPTVREHVSNIYTKTYNSLKTGSNERLTIRIRLILHYLKHIKVISSDWGVAENE